MTPKELQDLYSSDTDLGTLPQQGEKLNDTQRKLAALAQAVQAAILQLVAEGVIPLKEQGHFYIHLQDFMARLYAGETLDLGLRQSYKVDSRSGEVFLESLDHGFKDGRIEHDPLRPMGFKREEAVAIDPQEKKTVH